MTDRIDALAKQCWNHRIDGTLIDGHLHFDHRKFAELIVRECAAIAESRPIWVVVGKMIKEHFGVEE